MYSLNRSIDEMNFMNEMFTRITHNQKWTIIASLQHSYAIRLLLENIKPPSFFDFDEFYTKIYKFVWDFEKKFNFLDEINFSNIERYSKDLQKIFHTYIEQKNVFNKNSSSKLHNNIHLDKTFNDNSITCLEYSSLLRKLYKLIKKCRKGEKINPENLFKHTACCDILPGPLGLFSFMIATDKRCTNEVIELIFYLIFMHLYDLFIQ
jgi:hypothetical protein